MNKQILFDRVLKDYGKYIKTWIYRFHEKYNYLLDAIYGKEDIEQMVHLHIWTYLGKYKRSQGTLISYITNNMKWILQSIIYLSMMEKRQVNKERYLDQDYINDNGDITNLYDKLSDNSHEKLDNKINHEFNTMILKATYRRIYELSLEGYTQTEIGKLIHLSRERVRQIINKTGELIRKRDWRETVKIS